tara:strand:+ start:1102 stop:3189 length:2088 start_codon:yes stop_codon:yes gene_type:complete
MSASKKLLQSASGFINQSGGDNIEDYFDVTFWEGAGSSNTNVRTGVDLSSSGNGGMTMIKSAIQRDWSITDTVRGVNSQLASNTNAGITTYTNNVTHFLDYGFTLGSHDNINRNGTNNLAFTFQKKSKFFDIQTWTGNGTAGRTISHNLGQVPSMIWVKRTDGAASWMVYHKSLLDPTTDALYLDANNAYTSNNNYWNSTAPTASTLTVGSHYNINANGGTYVAYFFGDYEDENSFISSGTFTGQGTSYVDVNIGFEPQWILMKRFDGNSDWYAFNHKAGLVNEESYLRDHDAPVYLNHDYGWSEAAWGVSVKADGFRVQGHNISSSGHYYVYTAIRRPFMGEPTDYLDVFSYQNNAQENSTTGIPAFGRHRKPTDFGFYCTRANSPGELKFGARILQKNELTLRSHQPMDSANNGHPKNNSMFNIIEQPGQTKNGIANHRTDYGWWNTYFSNVDAWSFTRWKGICDIQTYRTTGSNLTFKHNLGAVPEFMAVKGLYGANSGYSSNWKWYHKDMVAGSTNPQYSLTTINASAATNSGYNSASVWQNTTPTDENVYIGTDQDVNNTQDEACVWMGFASYKDRVDVGYYTGNGTHTNNARSIQTNLSPSGYIRMILVKPVSQVGSWYWTDYASNGYYWLWNMNLGRIQSSPYPPLSCSYYGSIFKVFTNVSTNHEYSELGAMPLNKSGVRYVYVAFG